MSQEPPSLYRDAWPQPKGAMISHNARAANIGLTNLVVAFVPLVVIVVASLFRSNVVASMWFAVPLWVATTFFGVIAIGSAAMALNGPLTLRIGFFVGITYFVGVAVLGAVLILSLYAGVLTGIAWLLIMISTLAAVGVLFGIYRHCSQSPSAAE